MAIANATDYRAGREFETQNCPDLARRQAVGYNPVFGGAASRVTAETPTVLRQHEVGWCRTDQQSIHILEVSIIAKKGIAVLECRRSDPHIVCGDGAPLTA